jgi:hypothetical protein
MQRLFLSERNLSGSGHNFRSEESKNEEWFCRLMDRKVYNQPFGVLEEKEGRDKGMKTGAGKRNTVHND